MFRVLEVCSVRMAARDWDPEYRLMLEEARRSIDRQSERVQTVRERAIGLAGFGAVVAAAFGLGDTRARGVGVAGIVALLGFVIVAGSALYILRPRVFKFELSARRIESTLDLPSIHHLHYSLAIRHDQHHAYNYRKLERMQTAIAVGVLGLSIETLALVARLVLS